MRLVISDCYLFLPRLTVMDLVVAMSAFVDEEAMAQTYTQIKPYLEV